MSEEFRVFAQACKILKRTFAELEDHFEKAHNDNQTGEPAGAKHKSKAVEKEDRTPSSVESKSNGKEQAEGRKSSSKGEKTEKVKEKKHKEALKDANGNDLKRPLTAYMLFNNFRRPVLQKDHPDFSLTDLSKLIGQEWKNLNEDQRKVWTDKFAESKLEYDVKTYQAKKLMNDGHAQGDASSNGKSLQQPAEKKASMQSPAKKSASDAVPRSNPNQKDSLSSFTSDDDVQKPASKTIKKAERGSDSEDL